MNLTNKGRRKQIRGKVREKIGKMRGNRKQQVEGRLERLEGETKLAVARSVRKVRRRL